MTETSRHRMFCLVLALTALSVLTTACADSRPPRPSDSQKAKFESSVRAAYGRYLGQLESDVIWRKHVWGRPNPDGLNPGGWAFRADYSLKGLPLKFSYTALADPPFSEPSAYDHRNLIHDDLGGIRRFWLLAGQYHRDFPTQPTFAYWRTSDNGVSKEEPYRSLLKGHPGVSVVVYSFDDYWADDEAPSLGVYWWNKRRAEWVLVHRGSLPDLR